MRKVARECSCRDITIITTKYAVLRELAMPSPGLAFLFFFFFALSASFTPSLPRGEATTRTGADKTRLTAAAPRREHGYCQRMRLRQEVGRLAKSPSEGVRKKRSDHVAVTANAHVLDCL